jgi:nucleotide-binding universal stress UspA family protein
MNSTRQALSVAEPTMGIGHSHIPNTLHTVLLATDGTVYAEKALQDCINLLKRSGGKLVITFYADPDDANLYGGVGCQDAAEWRAYGQQVLDKLAEKARQAGVEEVITLLEDYQGEEGLNQVAKDVDADLIMLSSHLFQADTSFN